MDTRFWGPYGWDFLHSIPLEYNIADNRKYYEFFKLLGDMLPCKYCRNSYKEYFKELDLNEYLSTKLRLSKWLYLLHNKVNKKLRDQGLNDKKDPTFSEVKERVQYKQEKQKVSKGVGGIEFIYVIAFHYKNTTISGKTLKYRRFFKLLADVFPIVQVRSCLKKLIRLDFKYERCGMLRWWHRVYSKSLENCDYRCDICVKTCRERCEAHVSGCKKKSYNGKTCRKKTGGKVLRIKTRKLRR